MAVGTSSNFDNYLALILAMAWQDKWPLTFLLEFQFGALGRNFLFSVTWERKGIVVGAWTCQRWKHVWGVGCN